jgi:uncharacterized repeat protein (TIGR04138 family)
MSDEDKIPEILAKDPRFPRAAYDFVREALHHTIEVLGEQRHVSARELLDGIRDYAKSEFGPLARTVFESWNVRRTEDFGRIVFNLVEAGEMGKTDSDDIKDFAAGYDFDKAFPPETGDVRVEPEDEDE